MATSRECKFIETSSGLKHNVDELLVGVLKQIRLRESREKKLRRQGSKSKLLSKLHNSKTVLSLNLAREILNKMCLNDSKSKSCENLHVLWNIATGYKGEKAWMSRGELPGLQWRKCSVGGNVNANRDREGKRDDSLREGCAWHFHYFLSRRILWALCHSNLGGTRLFQSGGRITILRLAHWLCVPVRSLVTTYSMFTFPVRIFVLAARSRPTYLWHYPMCPYSAQNARAAISTDLKHTRNFPLCTINFTLIFYKSELTYGEKEYKQTYCTFLLFFKRNKED